MWRWLHRAVVTVLTAVAVSFLAAGLLVSNKEAIRWITEDHEMHVGYDFVFVREYQYEVPVRDRISQRYEAFGWILMNFETYEFPSCFSGPPTTRKFTNHLLLSIPMWHIALGLSIYPAIFFIRRYRRRRLNRQVLQPCGQCGYDLQGNESGTCPECGTATTRQIETEVAP